MKRLLSSLLFLGLIENTYSATLDISQTPLFLTSSVPPMALFVVSRDHKLYMEAYDDATDLDNDGTMEIKFKPSLTYFGYFDPKKCYSYSASNQYFSPVSVAANGQCSGQWSGNFLNYVTTSRLDALRKVLYGGYRMNDSTDITILERAYIPQDGHSWGRDFVSSAADGYNISNYTPFLPPPSLGYHLFANTTLRNGTGAPLLRVALNQPYRIWDWISIERPVAGSRALDGATGPLINGINDYVLRVRVCDSAVGLEDNCQIYPNGKYKPIGLLQEFGQNNSMYFGLITGSYNNNLVGGVLRKNVSTFTDEVNAATGQFTAANGIVKTLNNLTVTGFQTDYNYSCGLITTRKINNSECQMWGNPLAEMVFEAIRYYAGKANPTSSFDYSGGTDVSLSLPKPSWINPYSQFPRCSKANVVVLSDVYPSYDSDQVPGSFFNSFSSDLSPALNVSSLGQTIFTGEGFSSFTGFIGQSGNVKDGAPTPKTITSFGNIRGLSPFEANAEGSYNLASVSYYGLLNDVNPANGKQNVKSYMVALSAPAPQLTFLVGNQPITIIPFAKSVNGLSINPASGAFQPTNNIVDLYFESYTSTGAVFRVSFEDVQQGSDFDMDSIVRYTVTIQNNSLTINVETTKSAGSIIQHIGFIISGTTADGIYLVVRDRDTAESSDVDYFLDTPPGQRPNQIWQDHVALPQNNTRVFTPNSNSDATVLKSPLWYAAKWGGFTDFNKNQKPDATREFDADNNGDPDNYFLVTNASTLKEQLSKALNTILSSVGSFSSAALSSGFLATDTQIYQAIFKSNDWSGQLLAFSIDSVTGDVITTGSGPNGASWDAAQRLGTLNYSTGRKMITYKPSLNKGIPFRWPSNPASPGNNELDLSQVNALNKNPVTALADTLGSQRLNFIRGNQANELSQGGTFRDRTKILGDIINSNPIAIGAPEQAYPSYWGSSAAENNAPYSTFRQNNLTRNPIVYVGANDGVLHAFEAQTGNELFAYVPSPLISKLNLLTSDNYTHNYFADGSPTVIDAYIGSQWRTILVSGLNGGGQGIYALDITNPNLFTEASAASLVKWEFSDSNDADLGFTFSQPSIVRLQSGQWAAIFGNGYNNTYADGQASSTGNAVLYVVNLNTGALIRKFDTRGGMNQDPRGLGRPNGMSTPTVVDTDGNSLADLIYVGDLFGNVWKIDISSTTSSQWDFAFTFNNLPAPFFVAKDADNKRQPITSKIAVSFTPYNPSGLQIYVGTGSYIENSEKTDISVQTLYSLRDENDTPISGRASLRQQTIIAESGTTRITSDNQLIPVDRGWYLDLVVGTNKKGERITSNPIYINKKIIFTTLAPTSDPCDFGGESWLMALNAYDGARVQNPILDINKNNTIGADDVLPITVGVNTINVPASGVKSEVGLVSTPSVAYIQDAAVLYMAGTSGEIQKNIIDLGTTRTGRQSWKQLQ
jgi:type IV pilus assembly protein PilY1